MNMQVMMTNLEYYKAFYYVAKCGTITKAAHLLCLTQPSVTNAIQRLEEQLSCTLFVRTKRGVQLTREGQLLWNRVEPAMQLLLSGEQELRDVKDLEGGSIRIVSTEMSCRTYLIPTLERFRSEYPKVRIQFRNALTDSILAMVSNGEADLAVLHTPFQAGEEFELRYLDKIEECFVAGPRYRFLAERKHELSELLEYPMISMPEGTATRQFVSSLFDSAGLVFQPDVEVTTIDLVTQAVSHNFGIGMLPTTEAEEHVQRGEMVCLPYPDMAMERFAYVITSKTIPLSPAAQTYLDEYLFA